MTALGRRRFLGLCGLAIGAGAAGCFGLGEPRPWAMFRAEANNAAGTRSDPGADLAVGWSRPGPELFEVDGPIGGLSSPVADGARAYVAAAIDPDGDDPGLGVAAVDVEDGSVVWSRTVGLPTGTDVTSLPPILSPDLVFAIGGDRGVALERDTGRSNLEVALPWAPSTAPGGDHHLVALAGATVGVVELEETRDLRWADEGTATEAHNPPTVLDDRLLFARGDVLHAVRRGDGERLWSLRPPGGDPAAVAPPLVDGFHLHLRIRHGTGPDELVGLSRSERAVEWRRSVESRSTGPLPMAAYRPGLLYVPDGTDLLAVHVGNGATAWRTAVDVPTPYPTVGGEHLYALGGDSLVVLAREGGELRSSIALPGTAPDGPVEAVPLEGALLVSRGDRLLGLTSS